MKLRVIASLIARQIDIDAPHEAAAIPTRRPSAARGRELAAGWNEKIPPELQALAWRRSHSPVEAWTVLVKTGASEVEAWDIVAYLWLAELDADRYLALYPNSQDAPYAMYMKATSYFEQIKDITRDQGKAQDAITSYQRLIDNYPRSQYVTQARENILIAHDQLAGKEMSVGRYYLGAGQYAAAINRFRNVAEQYQTSTHIEEALYRLTEANLALGLTHEAQTAAAVLGHNYPTSSWYKQAFELLQKQGLSPKINEGSQLASLRQG